MPYVIEDINPVIKEMLYPTVMMWNRVEGRPRAVKNFDRALKAEVRDPLWMLTRQWQMGEFEGDYLSFENDWMDVVQKMAAQEDDADAREVADNLAVLRALGASVWSEGDTGHAKVRLALK
jgi:hypothetical protein